MEVVQEKSLLLTRLENVSTKMTQLQLRIPEELESSTITDSLGVETESLDSIIANLRNKVIKLQNELDEPFKIAVVGSQGTGKSTVVNLILGEELMPSTLYENENAVIRLRYASDDSLREKAVFTFQDGTTEIFSIDEALSLIDTNKQGKVPEKVQRAVYVTLYRDAEQLKKTEIINTPGMNVLTDDFYPKVQKLFVEADVILWVNGAEKILDSFNDWLIGKIYNDNQNIVGLITFPDKLYQMDEETGVTDVVHQFMKDVEKNRLLRIDGQLALFILHGKLASISQFKKGGKFLFSIKDADDEETKLRMIFNYLSHGFAYSDRGINIKELEQYNLYGVKEADLSECPSVFDIQEFIAFCEKKYFCRLNHETDSADYTEIGYSLIEEVSQYGPFERFTGTYLENQTTEKKVEAVKGRALQILSFSNDTSEQPIHKLYAKLCDVIEKTEEQSANEGHNIESIISELRSEFIEWKKNEAPFQGDKFTNEFLAYALDKIDREVGVIAFMKELLHNLTPGPFRKESPVGQKVNDVIGNALETTMLIFIKLKTTEAIEKVEYILLQKSKKILGDKELERKQKIHFETSVNVNPYIDFTNMSQSLSKFLKNLKAPLHQTTIEIMKKIASTKLRRGKNNKIVAVIVKKTRDILKKLGIKWAKKKAVKTAVKGGLGPLGWGLLLWDLGSSVNDMKSMYEEMKSELKSELKRSPAFSEMIVNQLNPVYDAVLEQTVSALRKEFEDGKTDISHIYLGKEIAEEAIDIMKSFNTANAGE